MIRIHIGTKVKFVPHIHVDKNGYPTEEGMDVFGEVVYIHRFHKMFTVKYRVNGLDFLESFKFCDIGKVVNVCG